MIFFYSCVCFDFAIRSGSKWIASEYKGDIENTCKAAIGQQDIPKGMDVSTADTKQMTKFQQSAKGQQKIGLSFFYCLFSFLIVGSIFVFLVCLSLSFLMCFCISLL